MPSVGRCWQMAGALLAGPLDGSASGPIGRWQCPGCSERNQKGKKREVCRRKSFASEASELAYVGLFWINRGFVPRNWCILVILCNDDLQGLTRRGLHFHQLYVVSIFRLRRSCHAISESQSIDIKFRNFRAIQSIFSSNCYIPYTGQQHLQFCQAFPQNMLVMRRSTNIIDRYRQILNGSKFK